MIPSSIDRFSIVLYKGKEYVLENKTKPATLITEDSKGKRTGIQIDTYTELEVVLYPAQLAFNYIKAHL